MAKETFKSPLAQAEALAKENNDPLKFKGTEPAWSGDSVTRDALRLKQDGWLPEKEKWSDAYYHEVKDALAKLPKDNERSLGPRKYTLDEAKKHIRAILLNDRNNSVYEAYDDYLQKNGKPSITKTDEKGGTIYPKGSWKTIVTDDGFLSQVADDLGDGYDNYYGDNDTDDDELIEKSLSQYLGDAYK